MIPPLQSLVKYDNAVLVSSAKDKGAKGKTATGKKVRPGLRVWDMLHALCRQRRSNTDHGSRMGGVSHALSTRCTAS